MEKYHKRRLVLTIVCVAITLMIFAAIVSYEIAANEQYSYDFVPGERIFNLALCFIFTHLCSLPIWDAYVSLIYFLGDPKKKTPFFTFVNVFALITAAVTVFEIVMMAFDPFDSFWAEYGLFDVTQRWGVFVNVCLIMHLADVVLRFVYLPTFVKRAIKVNTVIYDDGAHRITDSFEKPPVI